MIKLIQFPPAFGLPNPSPFCIKVEMLLKMGGLDYVVVATANPRRGPKRKLPAIEDGGTVIGDSELIRQHLERAYGLDFDAGLDTRARAVGHAFARMLEEHTYWPGVYSRWIDERFWPQTRDILFSDLPPVLRRMLPAIFRRRLRKSLYLQGMGRHSRDEMYAMGAADVDAVAAYLGDKPYVMGANPTSVDATVFAFVAAMIVPPFDTPLKMAAMRHDNLRAYVARVQSRFFAGDGAAGSAGAAMLHKGT